MPEHRARKCPVCRRTVDPYTDARMVQRIEGHDDTVGTPCPGSNHEFAITIADTMTKAELLAELHNPTKRRKGNP